MPQKPCLIDTFFVNPSLALQLRPHVFISFNFLECTLVLQNFFVNLILQQKHGVKNFPHSCLDIGINVNKAEVKTHKKTTLLRRHGGKEKDMKTTVHLLYVQATDAGQTLCLSFPPCFRSRVTFLCVCCSGLVPVLCIGSSLELKKFYRKFLLLALPQFMQTMIIMVKLWHQTTSQLY